MKKIVGVASLAMLACAVAGAASAALPDPKLDAPLAKNPGSENIVLAGGCFWGIQLVFQHVKGVMQAVAGYAGGDAATAHYEIVSTGRTGHAESVQITYDPSQITVGELLKVFFSVAHDPTEVNRQGPDSGTQYRSEIFFTSPEQQKIATAYIAQIDQAHLFRQPIATQVTPLQAFYAAEDHHQNYATLHPDAFYIAINDAPKLAALKKQLPELYVGK